MVPASWYITLYRTTLKQRNDSAKTRLVGPVLPCALHRPTPAPFLITL